MVDFVDNYQMLDYHESFKEQVHELIDKGFKSIGYTSIELDSIDKDLTDIVNNYPLPSVFKLLFDDKKLIASIAVVIEKGSDRAEIKRLSVDDEYRGQGIAKDLSRWAFDYAEEIGCKYVDIWSGYKCTRAHRLYQDLGAEKTGETRFLGGQDDDTEHHFEIEL